jgi:hypothetical protein
MDDNRDGDHDRMGKYIAIAKSADIDSSKTKSLTALLRQEENDSLLECFRGEGQWHGHGTEAHFEGAPDWKVVVAKLERLAATTSSHDFAVAFHNNDYCSLLFDLDADALALDAGLTERD